MWLCYGYLRGVVILWLLKGWYKQINNISNGQDLQNDLKSLESCDNEWQMSFNADKCFIIAAGTKNTKINYEYKIHNQDLEKVPLCTQ